MSSDVTGCSMHILQIACSDYDSDGSHDLIGSFNTTVAELMKAATGDQVRLALSAAIIDSGPDIYRLVTLIIDQGPWTSFTNDF